MDTKTEDTKNRNPDKMHEIGHRVSNLATVISALLSLLGGIASSASLVGFKKLSSQQLIIFGAIFVGIVFTTVILQQIQKMGQKIRRLRKKFEEAYISQLDTSFINPGQK